MKFKFFAFLFLAAALSGFSQDSGDWHGKPIRDIVFIGLRNIQQSEIEALINPYRGQNFDENIYWEMQGKLYALEYFDRIDPSVVSANVSNTEVIIRFTVVERPIIGRIIFNGNSGLSRRELNDVIISKVNDIFNQSKVRIDIEAITNKYLEKGYPNIAVSSSETQSADSSITLVFNIIESERISISKIEFVGNSRFSGNALRNQMSLKQRGVILSDGAFQESKLIADREAILKYYRDRGYIDARIIDITRSYEPDSRRTNLILTFFIDEGSEYRFGGVKFTGNVIFPTEQLLKLITSKEGDTVNMTRLEMDLQRVVDLYYENGYIYNVITSTPEKNTQINTISYSVSIIERSRAYIENIIIVGNEKTRTSVILREIQLEPGDIFSRAKIHEAMRDLYNLQFFSVVIPDFLQGSTENLMDLVFTFEEQPTTDIQFGLTFTGSADPDTFPISGLIKWNDRNIGGSGNQLGVELNSSIVDTSSLSINYLHRWIFGLPLSLGIDFSANYSKRYAAIDNQAPFFYGNEDGIAFPDGFDSYDEYRANNYTPTRDFLMTYEQWYLSLGFSSGYRWSTFLGNFGINGGVRIGLINNTYDDVIRPFDPVLRNGNNRWTPRNLVWFALSLDQRDIFYDPSRGYYLYERMGLYGILPEEREKYMKSDTKFQYYLTLFDIPVTETWNLKSVLAINLGISFLFGQPGREMTIENANKLSIDGMFVGRGWSSEYQFKGFMLLDNWVELRFPLVRGVLSFDFFFDAVAIDTNEGDYFDNFTIENFRFGYGGGIRFALPQFPIRLSLVKRFKLDIDGKVLWEPGILFGDKNNPALGMDLVMSFVIPY